MCWLKTGAFVNNRKVVHLPATTTMTPEQALASAMSLNLTDVLIVGYDENGELAVRSSRLNRAEAVFLMERAKNWALYTENGE